MATAIFIKPEDLKRKTIIDGSVDEDKFMGFIQNTQKIRIRNYLGQKLYERLQAGVIANDLNASEIILIDDYVADCLIYFATADYLPFSVFTVNNGGVFRHNSENSTPADMDDVKYLSKKIMSDAEYYAQRLVDYLCVNSALYPEYDENVDNDIRADKTVNNTSGFYFGGAQD